MSIGNGVSASVFTSVHEGSLCAVEVPLSTLSSYRVSFLLVTFVFFLVKFVDGNKTMSRLTIHAVYQLLSAPATWWSKSTVHKL